MSSSLRSDDSDHPLEVGVVFESVANSKGCAHEFRLDKLAMYLDGTTSPSSELKRHDQCLECRRNIAMVCDKVVATSYNENIRVVSFRYGKQVYRLAVDDSNKWWWQRGGMTAQARIAGSLRMNAKSGMKILCKGKVIYPAASGSYQEISKMLLEICQLDWSKSKKASLVVMGTRSGQDVRKQSHVLKTVYEILVKAAQWSFTVALQLAQSAFGIILWPLRLAGYLAPSRSEGREE